MTKVSHKHLFTDYNRKNQVKERQNTIALSHLYIKLCIIKKRYNSVFTSKLFSIFPRHISDISATIYM